MIKISIFLLAFIGLTQADTIEFNNGATLTGKVLKQSTTTATIEINTKQTTYAKSDIKHITLDPIVSAPPPPPVVATAPMPNTSKSAKEIQAGTQLHLLTTAPLNSAQHKKGYQFKMQLESDLLTQSGELLAKKGSDVYGIVVESTQAGRLIGKSSMIITLNALVIKDKRVTIKTNSINVLAPKKQGRDTAGKVLRGAAIGALADGHDGARTGAKVGLGLAVLTRGRATGVPAGTLLNFTLIANTKI